jgi:hypothetical protein
MNANSPLGSDGLPYSLPAYQYEGKMSGEEGKAKLEKASAPETRHDELPMDDEVVDFEP